MKNFILAALLAFPFFLGACSDEKRAEEMPFPETEKVAFVFPDISATENSYALSTANPVFTFSLDLKEKANDIAQVLVYKSFQRGTNAANRLPRVLQTTLTSFPATISVNLEQALTGVVRNNAPLTRALLIANDRFIFTFELVMKDGRTVVLTPLANGLVSGTQAAAPFAAIAIVVP